LSVSLFLTPPILAIQAEICLANFEKGILDLKMNFHFPLFKDPFILYNEAVEPRLRPSQSRGL
jgi:hypothetical protein